MSPNNDAILVIDRSTERFEHQVETKDPISDGICTVPHTVTDPIDPRSISSCNLLCLQIHLPSFRQEGTEGHCSCSLLAHLTITSHHLKDSTRFGSKRERLKSR